MVAGSALLQGGREAAPPKSLALAPPLWAVALSSSACMCSWLGGTAADGTACPLARPSLDRVNLIMDTMGALALATENPSPELLLIKPYGRDEPLITRTMWKHIFVQGMYQMFWMFAMLYAVPPLLTDAKYKGRYDIDKKGVWWTGACVDELGGPTANTTFTCNVMTVCGFPYAADSSDRNSMACSLYPFWKNSTATNGEVPADTKKALCLGASGGCATYDAWRTASDKMDKQYNVYLDKEYRPTLSMLFNTFIFAQVGGRRDTGRSRT